MKGMGKHIILGIHVTDRVRHAGEVQRLLSEYGCCIKTRLGLHETSRNFCSPNALILIEMRDDLACKNALKRKLAKVKGIEVKEMVFGHP